MRFPLKAIASLALFASAGATAQSPEISLKATEVVPGLIMLEGDGGFVGGNMALLTGDDAIVLIDNGLEPYAGMLISAIHEHTERPVDFVINTHLHGDHLGANRTLHTAGATIVAHDNVRKRLIEGGWQTREGMRPVAPQELPSLTFSDEMSFHLNGQTANVIHVQHAHTDGDSIIHFTGSNVIHTGDVMFNGMFPYIDMDSYGSVDGYLAAQRTILELADEQTKIIPGHGPLASKSDLQAAHDMLQDSNAIVKALVDAGKTEAEVLAEYPLADYDLDWTWSFITTEKMTIMLYQSNLSK